MFEIGLPRPRLPTDPAVQRQLHEIDLALDERAADEAEPA
jgi:hypothetical protein